MTDQARARIALPGQLVLALSAGLVAILLFLAIAKQVTGDAILTVVDLRVLAYLRARSTPDGDALMAAVSLLGSPLAMGLFATAGAAWLGLRRRMIPLTGWCCAFVGATVLTVGLKHSFRRVRPDGAEAFLHGTSFSFPSGHALGSLVGIGITAYLLIAFRESRAVTRVVTAMIAVTGIAAIGWSRLYLGVHYLSDVVAGFAAGGLWLSLCIAGIEYYRHRISRRAVG